MNDKKYQYGLGPGGAKIGLRRNLCSCFVVGHDELLEALGGIVRKDHKTCIVVVLGCGSYFVSCHDDFNGTYSKTFYIINRFDLLDFNYIVVVLLDLVWADYVRQNQLVTGLARQS
jgi:hypothetical protein